MQRNKASQRLIAIALTVGVHAVIFAAFYLFAIQKPINTPQTEFTAILLEPPPAENPSTQDSSTNAPPILPELTDFKKPVVTPPPKTAAHLSTASSTASAKTSPPKIETSSEKKQNTPDVKTTQPTSTKASEKTLTAQASTPHKNITPNALSKDSTKENIKESIKPTTAAPVPPIRTANPSHSSTTSNTPTPSKPQIAPKSIEKDEFEALKKELKQKEDIRKGLEAEIATTNVTRVASANKSETKPANPAVEADIKQATEAAAREAEIKKYYDESITRIKKKVRQKWEVPAGPKFTAMARITLSPTGDVLSIVITKTSGNTAFDESLKSAINDASPLPITYDPEVYKRLRIATYTFTSP